METWGWAIFAVGGALAAFALVGWINSRGPRALVREKYIRSYTFPPGIFGKLRETYPRLQVKDYQLIARALRHFFLSHLHSNGRLIGMPSRVADDLWHEFILDTRAYSDFCRNAFGRYFHHVPASTMGHKPEGDKALRLTWHHTCLEENIKPRKPTRLPLLFAIDEKLGIPSGFRYSLEKLKANAQEAGSGGCSGGSGTLPGDWAGHACSGSGLIGDSGGGSGSSCSGGASGCSGGCGGGCGGGS